MTFQSAPQVVQCPNCGVTSPETFTACPACGAPLDSGAAGELNRELATQTLIDDSHEGLISASAAAAESAFGVGCTLGLLGSAAIFAIVFLWVSEAWTVRLLVALISILISVVVASLLASRAKSATLNTTYGRRVRPEIERHMKNFEMTRVELASSAAARLPADSPLLSFLSGEETQNL